MSKKKAFSGSTMTLKDFHGGSIPSELPLPSAPGVSMRSPSAGQDRSAAGAWGAMARTDPHRSSRPGSAGARGLNEGSLFLPSTTRIGRNFDEDERKPFEAVSIPRRGVDPIPAPDSDSPRPPKPLARPGSSPGYFGGEFGFSAAASSRLRLGDASGGAWGLGKEAAGGIQVQQGSAVSASRFAQASAMEKILSGRWQLNSVPAFDREDGVQVDERSVGSRSSGTGDDVEGRHDGVMNGWFLVPRSPGVVDVGSSGGLDVRHGGSSPSSSDGRPGGLPPGKHEGRIEGLRQPAQEERFGRRQEQPLEQRFGELNMSQRGVLDGSNVHKLDEHFGVMQSLIPVERSRVQECKVVADAVERSKLKPFQRTEPLQTPMFLVSDSKQDRQSHSPNPGSSESAKDVHKNSLLVMSGTVDTDAVHQVGGRPRLNLKPRSESTGQPDGDIERERKTVFGGARPRELVLKERGIEIHANNSPFLADSRTKHEISEVDGKQDSAASHMHYSERVESHSVEAWAGKDHARKDSRRDPVKYAQWGHQSGESRKNTREDEKPPEHRPEPESWRKPVESPKPETPGPHYGKATSALELAQAFSRSASASDVTRSYPLLATNQKSIAGRSQVPFSRLTDNREIYSGPSLRKINGY